MSVGHGKLDRRAMLRVLTGAAAAGMSAACGARVEQNSTRTLDHEIDMLTARLSPRQHYRAPTDPEARRAVRGVEQLIFGDIEAARGRFAPLGFTVEQLHDAPARRDCLLAAGESEGRRTWGLLAVPAADNRPGTLIEVPHPRADRDTEGIGLQLFRAIPDAGLLVAGAHRRAAKGTADVAHQPDSLFHAIAQEFGRQGSMQLQLHGYADESLHGTDVVISSGRARVGERARRLADALEGIGLDVCRAWRDGCGALEGRTNAQGRTAGRHDLEFVHLELSHTTRTDTARCEDLVGAVAGVLGGIGNR
ncbi:hypothetical protein [Mycobacterium sp. C31M]